MHRVSQAVFGLGLLGIVFGLKAQTLEIKKNNDSFYECEKVPKGIYRFSPAYLQDQDVSPEERYEASFEDWFNYHRCSKSLELSCPVGTKKVASDERSSIELYQSNDEEVLSLSVGPRATLANPRMLSKHQTSAPARLVNGVSPLDRSALISPLYSIFQNAKGAYRLSKSIVSKDDPEAGEIGSEGVSLTYWSIVSRCEKVYKLDAKKCEQGTRALFDILEVSNPKAAGGLLHASYWRRLIEGKDVEAAECLHNLKLEIVQNTRGNRLPEAGLYGNTLKACKGKKTVALRVLGVFLGRNNHLEQYLKTQDVKQAHLSSLVMDLKYLESVQYVLNLNNVSGDTYRYLYPAGFRVPNLKSYHFYHRAFLVQELLLRGQETSVAVSLGESFGYVYEAYSDLSRVVSLGVDFTKDDEETRWDLLMSRYGAVFGLPDSLMFKVDRTIPENLQWKSMRIVAQSLMKKTSPDKGTERQSAAAQTVNKLPLEICPPCCPEDAVFLQNTESKGK